MIVVDGTPAVELDDVVVIGRQPDPTAARVDAAAICCTVTGDAAVSRTHLVVRSGAAGVTVVDCGSRSGSALIAAGRQPQTMDPWTPYDLGDGRRRASRRLDDDHDLPLTAGSEPAAAGSHCGHGISTQPVHQLRRTTPGGDGVLPGGLRRRAVGEHLRRLRARRTRRTPTRSCTACSRRRAASR